MRCDDGRARRSEIEDCGMSIGRRIWLTDVSIVAGLTLFAVLAFATSPAAGTTTAAVCAGSLLLTAVIAWRLRSARHAREHRAQAIDLLGEMAGRLAGACDHAAFAEAVELYAPRLLPGARGAVYATAADRTSLHRIGAWREPSSSAPDFALDDCWAVRRRAAHRVSSPSGEAPCRHVQTTAHGDYSCLPLMAQGEMVGVLHIEEASGAPPLADPERQILVQAIAASLLNLHLRESLRDQPIRDPLTGLLNRRFLEEAIEVECSRADRSNQPLSVLMADLDNFRQFNETFGREAGDIVLRQFGELLVPCFRRGDHICRLGNDVVLILLPASDLSVASMLAERVRRTVAGFDFGEHGRTLARVTVSVGVASYPSAGLSAGALMSAAERALHAAKYGGRNQVKALEESRPAGPRETVSAGDNRAAAR